MLTSKEFVTFIDKMIDEIKVELPEIARQFYIESGRGAISYFYRDTDEPEEPRIDLGYTKAEALPSHSYLRKLIEEYDPETELVVLATMDKTWVIRHVRFVELSD